MKRSISIAMMLGLFAAAAWAEPYWVAYEGNDYPENEGWWHIWGDQPGNRSIEDGVFVLDTLFDPHIADFYVMHMWGSLDPAPGETFVVQWRVQIDERSGEDISIGFYSDQEWGVGFRLDEDSIRSVYEYENTASFAPGLFHEFEFRSSDMREYQLVIDGQIAIEGEFWLSVTDSQVGLGDGVQGSASLSRWDYFRFGVVPEPAAAWGMVLAAAIVSRRNVR